MNRVASLLGLVAIVAACNDTTTGAVQQLNLDRPIDVAFACYGGLRITDGGAATTAQNITTSAQPLESCVVHSGAHDAGAPTPTPPGQDNLVPAGGAPVPPVQYYAFILQSAPGTVALAHFDTKPTSTFAIGDVVVDDADPLTPGKNGISVGEDPVAIVTDRVGCYEIVANAGSCDLSEVEINSALDLGTEPGVHVKRVTVKNAAGVEIHARPAAMVVEPASGTIGQVCPATATGLVYVAYPSCHLVAGIDAATGTIVAGVRFVGGTPAANYTDAVVEIVDGNVTCPDECDGAAVTPGVRPVAIDLERDERTDERLLAIGADNAPTITLAALDLLTNLPASLVTPAITLEVKTGKLGITSLALSPQIGMGGASGVVNDDIAGGGQFKFAYAVATDGTVRVAEIATLHKECDAQVDPRYLHDEKTVARLSCLPVGDPATPPRRATARSPGIELSTPDAMPTSVDVFKVDAVAGDPRVQGTPARMIGYFGVITSANGQSYVFNVDNDDFADFVSENPIATSIPLDIAHQLRDRIPSRGLLAEATVNNASVPTCNDPGPDPEASTGNTGGPRAVAPPSRTIPSGTVANEKAGGLPSIRQVLCTGSDATRPVSELAFAAPIAVRDATYPDLRGLTADETWTLTWEGSLSADKADLAIDGPAVREGSLGVDASGLRLFDDTHPFCDAGVEPFDIVQLRGCDPAIGDAGCPLGYTCYVHPNSQVTGLGACMLKTEADRLANACKAFLTSTRRYTVGTSASGELVLKPRKRVLRTTPLDGCVDDNQCATLANYTLQLASSANPQDDMTAADTHTWACHADPDRAPMLAPSTGKRCIATCDVDADCQVGTVCQLNTASSRAGYCMEGVVPPQACVNSPQRFELRAGEAFAALGTRSGYIHPIIAGAGGACVRDPAAPPTRIGRIPLRAAACDATADPLTGKRMDGTYEPNPCALTVDETEYQLSYVPGTCTLADPDETLVTRPAQAIRFRGRGIHFELVDPTYQGDAVCVGDRGGTLSNVPIVPTGFQIAFRQTAGFSPLLLGITPSFPVKVLRGPLQSIWIVDEGDFLSTSLSQPSTRGRVYRIESQAIGVVNLLQ